MRSNGSSDLHQNNNLKVVLAFGNFIGKDILFYDVNKKEQILEFLNTKVKNYDQINFYNMNLFNIETFRKVILNNIFKNKYLRFMSFQVS
jgi:hypothetical protein